MSDRFFLAGRIESNTGILDGEQAHHAIHVMRCSAGQRLVLFDSTGREYVGQIIALGKRDLSFAILETREPSPPATPEICVAASLPKGDRQKFMLEKLVELGVDSFIPLHTRRSVSVAPPNVLQRLERGIIEATKQCGRRSLMALKPELSVAELMEYCRDGSTQKLLADPHGALSFSQIKLGADSRVVAAVGPEGGFDAAEVALFRAAEWQPARIGSTILRVETAAIAAATLLLSAREMRENSQISSKNYPS